MSTHRLLILRKGYTMKLNLKKIIAGVVACATVVSCQPVAAAAFSATVDTVRIGIYNSGAKNYASANLQNVTNYGYGYELGYYDSDRDFHSLGGSITDTNTISMIIDRNMVYNSSSNSYSAGTSGSVVVGCFHIQLDTAYSSYASALAAAGSFSSANAFVKYSAGNFYVCLGSYISADAASSAASSMGIGQSYSITSGTSYTVTVVETGTSRILFEFEYGTSYYLAVRPIKSGGTKTQTWFKGYKYYGDFTYVRASGGNMYVVNYVNLEDYVKGVLPYEMSASWPKEALKAQAVSARTFVIANLNKHRNLGFDICNTDDCQVYRGTGSANSNSDAAVEETAGKYLTYNGSLCETYYYSCNGGASENSENVWSAALPYCRGVADPYESKIADSFSKYYWTETYTGSELASKLQSKGYSCSTIVNFQVSEFTPTGNVLKIMFTDSNGKTFTFSKERCRTLLGLNSQRYTINGTSPSSSGIYVNGSASTINGDLSDSYAIGTGGTDSVTSGNVYAITGTGTIEAVTPSSSGSSGGSSGSGSFVISGSGWGHNVGMSQWGAYCMAKYYNLDYEDILTFYYTGAEVTTSK